MVRNNVYPHLLTHWLRLFLGTLASFFSRTQYIGSEFFFLKIENEKVRCPLVSSKKYKLAISPIKDSDHPAHPRSLIRVLDGRSLGCQGSYVSSGGTLRLWPDCVDAQTDLNLHCAHIETCTLCRVPVYGRKIGMTSQASKVYFAT